jgi:hypothetical protein
MISKIGMRCTSRQSVISILGLAAFRDMHFASKRTFFSFFKQKPEDSQLSHKEVLQRASSENKKEKEKLEDDW